MHRIPIPLVVALSVAVLGLATIAVTGTEPDVVPDLACSGLADERAEVHISTRAWPPGATRCVVRTPAGDTFTRTTLPWDAWLAIALLAAAAGCLAARRSALAALLFLAAFAAYFTV